MKQIVMNELKAWVSCFLMVALVVAGISATLVQGQNRRTRTNRVRNDPRGQNRYTLVGETTSLSIFSLPRYNPRDPNFFDGFGRKSAEELGLVGAEFWNEFGNRAELGIMSEGAVIRFKNGFQWDEAYLEGCLKNGQVYYNRIKLVKKPSKPVPPVVKELCINIPLAIEDVPSDWTIKTNPDGTKSCHYPIEYRDREIPCVPGVNQKVIEHHDRKGFDPATMIREKLTTVTGVAENMAPSAYGSKVTSLIVYYNGCNVFVYVHSTISKGMGWMVWLIPVAFVAGFLLGYFLRGGGKSKMIQPIKTNPPRNGRPVITF